MARGASLKRGSLSREAVHALYGRKITMTASRLVFSGCGLVVLVSGVLMLVEKLRRRRLPSGRPDIIDV